MLEQQSQLIHAEKVASLGVLSAGVAHNLNTPLGTISVSSGIIEHHLTADKVNKKDVLKTIHVINRTVTKMSDMIKTLREFSVGHEIKSLQKVDILNLVEESMDQFKSLFNINETIDINITTKGKAPFLAECNPDAIQKALLCVLQNAFEAIIEKSNENSKGWINIEVSDLKGRVHIELRNSGRP